MAFFGFQYDVFKVLFGDFLFAGSAHAGSGLDFLFADFNVFFSLAVKQVDCGMSLFDGVGAALDFDLVAKA